MKMLKGVFNDTWRSLDSSFDSLWGIIGPNLLPIVVALIVLVIGLTIAGFVGDKIGELINKIKLGSLLDKFIFGPFSRYTGAKINASVIGEAIKWFLVGIVLIATLDLANLTKVNNFFNQALGYFPSIIAAVLIMIIGSILASFAATLVKLVTKKDNLSATARVAVNILAFLAALGQIVTPLVASLSHLIGQLSLSKLQADVLFIGVIVLVLLASKNTVTKTVESLYKSQQ